jgi:hypothetical protein
MFASAFSAAKMRSLVAAFFDGCVYRDHLAATQHDGKRYILLELSGDGFGVLYSCDVMQMSLQMGQEQMESQESFWLLRIHQESTREHQNKVPQYRWCCCLIFSYSCFHLADEAGHLQQAQ